MTNEETVLPTEMANDPAVETVVSDSTDLYFATEDGALIVADSVQETETSSIIQAVETAATDLAHVNLFGSFLICGTLIGLALFRRIYGT